jgi:hypothetical protein
VCVYNVNKLTALKDKVVDGRGLHYLSKFTNTTQIDIELCVAGTTNRMDLTAQQMIKEVSGVMKRLIDKFEDKVRISTESVVSLRSFNIRLYWDPVDAGTVERLWQGKGYSSKELIQIQIVKWTGVLGKVLDVNGDLVSLL